jgi:signal-transduction protein with cAMP-binding, CBS, and nucleotidyltransferase domain
MVVDTLAAPLLRVELFAGLKPAQLSALARAAERIVYRAGDSITRAGDEADAAILIVSGSAEWMDEAVEEIEIGSLIAEMAMFVELTYGTTIVAKSQVRCLKLGRAAVRELLLNDQDLAQHMTTKIAARLSRVANELRAIDDAVVDNLPAYSSSLLVAEQALTH